MMLELNYRKLIAAIAVCLVLQKTQALECYTCSFLSTDKDNTCLLQPHRVTDCDKKYCTIVRQESTKPAGQVISFIRDCLDKPLHLNKVVVDETFKTYFRSCTTDLCNDSDGKQSSTNVDPNFGAAPNTVIKGKNAAPHSLTSAVNGSLLGVGLLLALSTYVYRVAF